MPHRTADELAAGMAEVLTNRGFLTLARTYWRTGAAEMWRDWWAPSFVAAIRRYLPMIEREDVEPGPSGVRAQAMGPDGTLVEDFLLTVRPRVVHVRNAPSPAATASLAIGREIAAMAVARFEIQA